MAEEPLVSVIIPVYNGERYLAEAVDSALRQRYRRFEIIVIDDGSTDATPEVVRGYGEQVSGLVQPNQGTAAARNRGVESARGELYAFLDADDVWLEHKLAAQVIALSSESAPDVVFGHVEQFVSPDVPEDVRRAIRFPAAPMPGHLPSTMMVRANAFARVGAFETGLKLAEFAGWFARAKDLGLQAVMLPEVVARRRLHSANKGVVERSSRQEYLRVLKASLDRRRAQGRG